MFNEAFEQELCRCLSLDTLLHPVRLGQDGVKFVFQAMLGMGHLLSSREQITARIALETEGLSHDMDEPLFEPLSPDWCRLNLRKALALGIPPRILAGMMLASVKEPSFSRQEAVDACQRLKAAGLLPDDTDPRGLLQEGFLPSHSPVYREQYHPAYRVVASDWMSHMAAILAILEKDGGSAPLLITLDGPCASGKTTLAKALSVVLDCPVIHTDDFVIPHALKTPERLSVPGGNCDSERLLQEVILPFKQGLPVVYRPYDCAARLPGPQTVLSPSRTLIVEGSYSSLPRIRAHADVCLFLQASRDLREKRLRERESPDALQMFYSRWIPLEDAYFEAFHLPDEKCVLLRS